MKTCAKHLFLSPASILVLAMLMATSLFGATVKPPTLTITAPKTNAKWSNAVYTVTGTVAKGSAGVTNVFVSVGADGWNSFAVISNKTWLAQVSLSVGTNTIAAYAVDTNGVPSKTNTVKLIYVLVAPLTLVINPAGTGTVSPNDNNAFLAIGDKYTLKATPAKGFGFYYWDVGEFMSNSTSLSFTMVSNLVITANFRDITPPTLTITAPKAGGKFTNSTIEVTGTASDNVGVDDVSVQINGNGWVPASGTTSWSASLPMTTGNNTVEAVAMDAAGNISKTNTVTFLGFAPPAPPQPYWAPLSLTNTLITLSSIKGDQGSLSFGDTQFSASYTNYVSGYSGIGGPYAYQATATNFGLAQLPYLNPPPYYGYTANLDLVFTGFNVGYYTNSILNDSGTFSIAINVASLLPANWSGQSFTFTDNHADFGKLTLSGINSFSLKESNGNDYAGTYTVDECSPVSAYLIFTSYDATTLHTTYFYLQMTYTAAGKGLFTAVEYVDTTTTITAVYQGTFVSP